MENDNEVLDALIHLLNACDKWLPHWMIERLNPEYSNALKVVIAAHNKDMKP